MSRSAPLCVQDFFYFLRQIKNKHILRLPQIHYIIQPKIFCNVNKIICTFIRRKEQQWPGIRERYRAGSSPSGSQLYKPEFISPSSHKISLFFSFFHPFANIRREISRNKIQHLTSFKGPVKIYIWEHLQSHQNARKADATSKNVMQYKRQQNIFWNLECHL